MSFNVSCIHRVIVSLTLLICLQLQVNRFIAVALAQGRGLDSMLYNIDSALRYWLKRLTLIRDYDID